MAAETESLLQESAGVAIPRFARVWLGSTALVTALTIVLYGIVLLNQVYLRPYDYPQHIAWARELSEGEFHLGGVKLDTAYRPNFLFQLLIYGLAQVPRLDFERSALAVSLLASVALALVIHALMYRGLPNLGRPEAGLAAMLLTLVALLVGPLSFLTWHRDNLYLGYIAPITYHNPTVTLLRPFALLLFIYALKAMTAPADRSTRDVVITALLTALATYAKPNYTLCLLPVMGGVLAAHWLRRLPANWRLILGGIILPGTVALGLQYSFTFEANVENAIIFSPLTVARSFESVHIFPKLALSLVFPVVVVALYIDRVRHDTALLLAWPVTTVALGYAYLLAEEGMPGDGNFFWGAQVALFILFVFSLRFLAQQMLERDRRLTWRSALCAGVLALHVVTGSFWYLTEALLQQPRW